MTDDREPNPPMKFDWDAGDRPIPGTEDWYLMDAVKAEARAEGTRETAAYIERLYPAGLVNRADVLADMKIAADRQSRRIHANGRARADVLDADTKIRTFKEPKP